LNNIEENKIVKILYTNFQGETRYSNNLESVFTIEDIKE